jgi:hypothetical protein
VWPTRWSDKDVAIHMQRERYFWEEMGARFCVAYQIRDGQTTNAIDRYGFVGVGGRWKPVASRFCKPSAVLKW